MAEESTFFQSGGITVTNARFIVGAQTFAMRGITSVEGVEHPPIVIWTIIFVVVGLLMALNLFAGNYGIGVFGLLIFAVGIWLRTRQRSKFSVVLRTAGGEITAYQSPDREFISSIIQALNQAIVSQG